MNFTTVLDSLREISIYGLGENIEVENPRFVVQWSVYIDYRQWGIKDFEVCINDIDGEYTVVTYDDKGDAVQSEQKKFTFDGDIHKLANFVAWSGCDQLSINNIEIDVQQNTVEIA